MNSAYGNVVGTLVQLAQNFDLAKVSELTSGLKKIGDSDLTKIIELVQPIAGGALSQIMGKIAAGEGSDLADQLKAVLANVSADDIQGLAGKLMGNNIQEMAGGAIKGALGNLFN